jgi:hypothetical protein
MYKKTQPISFPDRLRFCLFVKIYFTNMHKRLDRSLK